MEAISDYLASNPAVFTVLTILVVVVILYSLATKLIKFAIVLAFIVLVAGSIYLFKDPAAMPDKIENAVETLSKGGEQIKDKFANLWDDTKGLAKRAAKTPGEINDMLDTSREEVGK